jgi:quercetin dioxygenase-like cupin family protein
MICRRKLMPFLALSVTATTVASIHCPALGQSSETTEAVIVASSQFPVTNAPAQHDVLALLVNFPPGAWTSLHTHGGQAVNLVLEGTITYRQAGADRPYRAGEAWSDSSGAVHAAGNIGSSKARLLTNFLLPQGAPQTTSIRASQFEPSVTYQARFLLPRLPAEAEIRQQVLDLSPGSRVEKDHDVFAVTMVIEGEVTHRIGAEEKTYRTGEAWSAKAGASAAEENRSSRTARLFKAYLAPSETRMQ